MTTSIPSVKVLRVGHSPDADDAYMFYGLAQGGVPLPGYRIEHVIEDIQSLNVRAMEGDLEVTAISAAVYPQVAQNYWIMSCGASVGRNYGPILAAKPEFNQPDFKNVRIAIPGEHTTAYLLLKIFVEGFIPVVMDFDAVMPAVENGEADVALVIHEGQLRYGEAGFKKCLDLGQLWFEKYKLPIPLGLDMIRKDLGWEEARKIAKALKASIQHAMKHQNAAIRYAAQYGRGTDADTLEKFVGMYVNEDTLDLGVEGKDALQLLFKLAVERGHLESAPPIEIVSAD